MIDRRISLTVQRASETGAELGPQPVLEGAYPGGADDDARQVEQGSGEGHVAQDTASGTPFHVRPPCARSVGPRGPFHHGIGRPPLDELALECRWLGRDLSKLARRLRPVQSAPSRASSASATLAREA